MKIHTNASLKRYNTLGLDVLASRLLEVENSTELRTVIREEGAHAFILGEGSNLVFSGDVSRPVIRPQLKGVTFEGGQVTAAAGENWHSLVEQTVAAGLSGIENLALIPGTVGAAPVQNIGAYGVELNELLEQVEVYDRQDDRFLTLAAAECGFGYRTSVFKSGDARDRYVILSMTLALRTEFEPNIEYGPLRAAFRESPPGSPKAVMDAVVEIRKSRLPDPSVVGNAGSFFKNPVVDSEQFERLIDQIPDLSGFPAGDDVKVPAARLIEAAGLKGAGVGGARVSEQHALVIENAGRASPSDVLAIADLVVTTVWEKYEVRLEREPDLV